MQPRRLSILATILLMGCGESSDFTGSFVGGDETAIIQLQLVESENETLKGTIAISEPDYDAGKLKTIIKPVSGTKDQSKAILVVHNSGFGASDGSLSIEKTGSSIYWNVPTNGTTIELSKTDQEGYRERLAWLGDQLGGNDVGMIDYDAVD